MGMEIIEGKTEVIKCISTYLMNEQIFPASVLVRNREEETKINILYYPRERAERVADVVFLDFAAFR